MRTLAKNLDRAVALLALALNAPRFDEEPFERVREQIKAHLRHEMNDPNTVAYRGFRARVFAGHPYEHPADGTQDSLDALQRPDMSALHHRLLARDALHVAVVGAIAGRSGRAFCSTRPSPACRARRN